MSRNFEVCRAKVHNRGRPPIAFLEELVDWTRGASDDIFVESAGQDIYASVVGELGPWKSLRHRKAAMMEVLRVLGGFESSWSWQEGKDVTGENSDTPCTEEAGLFQCSGNSMSHDASLKALLVKVSGKSDCDTFRQVTKDNHAFAFEYCARLLRFTTNHHGPIKGRHIHPWLSTDAVAEFESFLTP